MDLSFNQISEFPEDFELLTDLRGLDISSNKISELPIRFYLNRGLAKLNLADNQIKALPHSVGTLTYNTLLSLAQSADVKLL